ncbi:immunoglobulin-binding protein 1 isoform X1 [Syngnathus typhle]|uniref:immunoglobulin-binding protein 1 isoform X1 n=1 Tax=Syngnathus typhle TaxID=161592 RepID=UPI002A6B7537|nr:immunoglobulin-binding protein 1 isoform X1 [Syngnathus typhle]
MAECKRSGSEKHDSHSGGEAPKLSDLFDRGWKILDEVDNTNDPLASNSVQVRVKRAIGLFEETSRMASQLDLFSLNEELDEIATADLKYLLSPALLGALTMKLTGRDKRLEIVQTARAYFMDFLKRCKDYNISHFHLPESVNESPISDEAAKNAPSACTPMPSTFNLVAMAAQRQAKIERYSQKKELEARLLDVRRSVESGQADDETSRDFYLLNVRKWVILCLDEVQSIDQEMEILKSMDQMQLGAAQPAKLSRPPMRPFILTKDAMQAQVFGAGYPSLPTMTVDDWYDQHKKHGVLPDQGVPRRGVAEDDTDAKEREEEEKEKQTENDDDESLMKARKWDEWKDDHRRGYGNRQNMG